MRTLSGGERTQLAAQTVAFHAKVEVKNEDGTWIDVSSRFVSADISTDVDQPVWSAVIAFARDDQANTASLSPLRSDSSLNVDNSAAYSPLLTAGREIRVAVATLAIAATPIAGDYKYLFWGRIDKPEFGQTPMTVECRDLGGLLIDTTVSEEIDYGDADDPVPVADVMQQVLDDVLGAGVVTLVDALGSDFVVTSYKPRNIPLMEAMSSLATKAGGAVARYRISDAGVPEFTLYEPVRATTTPDATIPPTEYLEIPGAAIDKTNVRNRIRGQFIDPVTGEVQTLEVEDTASQNAGFGVMFMQLGADVFEGLSGTEVLAILNAALSDLKYPKFDHAVECLLWWPSEVGDFYRFSSNAVHYNAAQDLAVMGIAHSLTQGHGTTRFTCRGTPAGAYLDWIRRQGGGPTGPQVPPAAVIMFVLGELSQFGGTVDTVDGALWIGYVLPVGVDEMRVHVLLGDGENLPIPNVDATTLALTIRRPEGDIAKPEAAVENRFPILPGEYASIAILSTDPQFWKRLLIYTVRGGLTSTHVIRRSVQAVDPVPARADGTIASISVVRDGSTNTVTVTPGTLESGDPTNNGNWLVIMRNKHCLPPIFIEESLAPRVFADSGLDPSVADTYVYEAFIWNGGQSGPLRRTGTQDLPAVDPPVFALGTPLLASVGGLPRVQVSWTATTAGASSVRVEASLDQLSVRTVGAGVLASGTVYDTVTSNKRYRLVALDIASNPIAYSAWKWQTGLPPGISNPGAVPQFTVLPRVILVSGSGNQPALALQIKWSCATPGATAVAIMRATAGAGGPFTEVGKRSSVSSGEWLSQDADHIADASWFKLEARDAADVVLASSVTVAYTPP